MSIPLHLLLHLFTACATLALGLSLHAFSPVSRVVEIDSEALLRQFVSDLGEVPDTVLKDRTATFLATMQSVLDRFALQNGVIVVETQLAIAGAQDVTDEAYRQVVFMLPRDTVEVAR